MSIGKYVYYGDIHQGTGSDGFPMIESFRKNKSQWLTFSLRPIKPIWLAFDIVGAHLAKEPLFLRLNHFGLKKVNIFLFKDNILIKKNVSGSTLPFSYRDTQHRDVVFALPVESEFRVLLKIDHGISFPIVPEVVSQRELLTKTGEKKLWIGIYIGIIGSFLVYHFLVYLLGESKIDHLFFCGYLLWICGLAPLAKEGWTAEYLWGTVTLWAIDGYHFMVVAGVLCLFHLVMNFFTVAEGMATINDIVKKSSVALLTLSVWLLLAPDHFFLVVLFDMIVIFISGTILFFIAKKSKIKVDRKYFCAAWFIFIGTYCFDLSKWTGLYDLDPFRSSLWFFVLNILATILFSYALRHQGRRRQLENQKYLMVAKVVAFVKEKVMPPIGGIIEQAESVLGGTEELPKKCHKKLAIIINRSHQLRSQVTMFQEQLRQQNVSESAPKVLPSTRDHRK